MEAVLIEIWQKTIEIVSSEGFRWTATFLVAIVSLVVAISALRVSNRATDSAIAMQEIAEKVERREVRPHLLIPEDAWSFKIHEFSNGRRSAEVRFSKLRNAGSGPATYLVGVMRAAYPKRGELPIQLQEDKGHLHIHGGFEGTVVSFIPHNETNEISFAGHFPWPEVGKDYADGGLVFLKIEIYFSDVEGRRYQTVYSLFVSPKIWSGAPGVQLTGPRGHVEDGKLVFEEGFKLASEFDTAGAGISYARMESNEWAGKRIDQNFWLKSEDAESGDGESETSETSTSK